LLCFLHRFHKRSRVRAPAKSLLRFRRRDVVPNRRRNLYLRYYSAAFASFRTPIPTSPLSASRLPTPRLWGTIRVYSVPLIGHAGSLGALCTPAVWYAHDGGDRTLRTHCKKSAEHLPLPSSNDACESLHLLNRVARPHCWGPAL
jgi:hypothetical protein